MSYSKILMGKNIIFNSDDQPKKELRTTSGVVANNKNKSLINSKRKGEVVHFQIDNLPIFDTTGKKIQITIDHKFVVYGPKESDSMYKYLKQLQNYSQNNQVIDDLLDYQIRTKSTNLYNIIAPSLVSSHIDNITSSQFRKSTPLAIKDTIEAAGYTVEHMKYGRVKVVPDPTIPVDSRIHTGAVSVNTYDKMPADLNFYYFFDTSTTPPSLRVNPAISNRFQLDFDGDVPFFYEVTGKKIRGKFKYSAIQKYPAYALGLNYQSVGEEFNPYSRFESFKGSNIQSLLGNVRTTEDLHQAVIRSKQNKVFSQEEYMKMLDKNITNNNIGQAENKLFLLEKRNAHIFYEKLLKDEKFAKMDRENPHLREFFVSNYGFFHNTGMDDPGAIFSSGILGTKVELFIKAEQRGVNHGTSVMDEINGIELALDETNIKSLGFNPKRINKEAQNMIKLAYFLKAKGLDEASNILNNGFNDPEILLNKKTAKFIRKITKPTPSQHDGSYILSRLQALNMINYTEYYSKDDELHITHGGISTISYKKLDSQGNIRTKYLGEGRTEMFDETKTMQINALTKVVERDVNGNIVEMSANEKLAQMIGQKGMEYYGIKDFVLDKQSGSSGFRLPGDAIGRFSKERLLSREGVEDLRRIAKAKNISETKARMMIEGDTTGEVLRDLVLTHDYHYNSATTRRIGQTLEDLGNLLGIQTYTRELEDGRLRFNPEDINRVIKNRTIIVTDEKGNISNDLTDVKKQALGMMEDFYNKSGIYIDSVKNHPNFENQGVHVLRGISLGNIGLADPTRSASLASQNINSYTTQANVVLVDIDVSKLGFTEEQLKQFFSKEAFTQGTYSEGIAIGGTSLEKRLMEAFKNGEALTPGFGKEIRVNKLVGNVKQVFETRPELNLVFEDHRGNFHPIDYIQGAGEYGARSAELLALESISRTAQILDPDGNTVKNVWEEYQKNPNDSTLRELGFALDDIKGKLHIKEGDYSLTIDNVNVMLQHKTTIFNSSDGGDFGGVNQVVEDGNFIPERISGDPSVSPSSKYRLDDLMRRRLVSEYAQENPDVSIHNIAAFDRRLKLAGQAADAETRKKVMSSMENLSGIILDATNPEDTIKYTAEILKNEEARRVAKRIETNEALETLAKMMKVRF